MTLAVLALAGWFAALAAATLALAARRALAGRIEDVARASHELRGGIGAVRLGLALAGRAGELAPSRLRAVELELDRAALALEHLDGRPPMWAFGYVDIEELLADCVEAARGSAAVRGAELRLNWSGARAVVIGDRVRLAQATTNLIANAIEHGGGAVEVRGARAGRGVTVEVVDAGPGLAKPVAELVRRRRGHGARGRGLGIAAEIAEGHGGRLSAAPSSRGARLVLELPATPESQLSLHAG